MRLFIAVKVPKPIIVQISEFQKSISVEWQGIKRLDLKWVEPENMHLTLKFLGETPDKIVDKICTIVGDSIQGIKPFNISFSSLGGFPNLMKPRVLWIGVEEGREKIVELIQRLNEKLSKIGFEPETRESTPHLTIGRIKRVERNIDSGLKLRVKGFKSPVFLADKIYLIKSELTSAGPIYTDIKEFSLLQ